MALELWKERNIWDPFEDFRKEMESVLDRFTRFYPREFTRGEEFAPMTDVYETDDALVVKADLPGLTKKDVKVRVRGNNLEISGEKKSEKEEKKRNYHISERYYGKFYRSFALPDYVDTSKISAGFKDGVLEVSIPKKEEEKLKAIDVEVK